MIPKVNNASLQEKIIVDPIPILSRSVVSSTSSGVVALTIITPEAKENLIQNGLNTLSQAGSCANQIKKIKILLSLVHLYKSYPIDMREKYFYEAVSIAQHYFGKNLWDKKNESGQEILNTYYFCINENIPPEYHYVPVFLKGICASIIEETIDRKEILLKTTEKKIEKGYTRNSHMEIIKTIEANFGPVRLLILSKCGDVVTTHNLKKSEIKTVLEKSKDYQYPLDVDISGKIHHYKIVIDRGSFESKNQFKKSHIEGIINRLLRIYILKQESQFTKHIDIYTKTLQVIEKKNQVSSRQYDYRAFIERVAANTTYSSALLEIQEDPEYIKHALQAIDISSVLSLAHLSRDSISMDTIVETIDTNLGGKINRKVLAMVSAILLSRYETMHGMGYPFNINKKEIPLVVKIYTIIQDYEMRNVDNGLADSLKNLSEWRDGGYFDPDILEVFLGTEKTLGIPILPLRKPTNIPPLSSRRIKYYKKYLLHTNTIMDLINRIEDAYYEFRKEDSTPEIQKIMVLLIGKLKMQLRKEADLRTLIVLTRHGETISDSPDGPPGDDAETLTEKGVMSSRDKGKKLKGLSFRISPSPIARALETSEIIREEVMGSVNDILSGMEIPITPEHSLRNPSKSKNVDRVPLLIKTIQDNPKDIIDFLKGIVSTSQTSLQVLVAHRDTGRHVLTWLHGMFPEDHVYISKMPFENDTVYELYFRGDHPIEGEEEKTKGLLFTLTNWQIILNTLNEITLKVFGKIFCDPSKRPINLIDLHDQFLDYIDLQYEQSPGKMGIFLKKLKRNELTKHFAQILKTEGVIK